MLSFHIVRYVFVILLFTVISASTGCKNTPSPFQAKTATISGVITGGEKVGFVVYGPEKFSGDFGPDGTFKMDIRMDDPGIFIFTSGRLSIPVYVKPGSNIDIKARTQKPHNIEFAGDNIPENQYLQIHSEFKKDLPDNNYGLFYTQDEFNFIKSVEERTQELVRHSQDYQKVNGVFDSDFSDLLSRDIIFESAIIKMNYPEYYAFFKPDSTLILSETYDSFLQNIDTDDADQLLVPHYHAFLPIYLDFITRLDTSLQISSHNIKKYEKIDQLFTENKVKSKLYLQLAEEMISSSVDEFHIIYDDFIKKNIKPELKVKQLLQGFDNKKHLIKGQKAPDDIFQTMDAGEISFQDFKGKVLYIDVWATWCGPCIREIPYLEKKQEQFKNKDVVFISISVDEERGPWEYMVKDKNLRGQQWYAPASWQSALAQNYRITGIPRFIIIDREGNIFNAYAPRPSFDEFDNAIEEALTWTSSENQ